LALRQQRRVIERSLQRNGTLAEARQSWSGGGPPEHLEERAGKFQGGVRGIAMMPRHFSHALESRRDEST